MSDFYFGQDVVVDGRLGKILHYAGNDEYEIDFDGIWEVHKDNKIEVSEKIELTEELARKMYCEVCSNYLQCCMNKKIGCYLVDGGIEIWRVNGHVIIKQNPVEKAKEMINRRKKSTYDFSLTNDEEQIYIDAIEYLEKQQEENK